MVSVPLTMTVTTDVYAAAKKAKKAAKAAPKAAPKETGVQPPFHAMWRATNDLGQQLATGGKK
jgi:hypothetical protein